MKKGFPLAPHLLPPTPVLTFASMKSEFPSNTIFSMAAPLVLVLRGKGSVGCVR